VQPPSTPLANHAIPEASVDATAGAVQEDEQSPDGSCVGLTLAMVASVHYLQYKSLHWQTLWVAMLSLLEPRCVRQQLEKH
jgi:hypothetical protein